MDWGQDGRLYGPQWFTGEVVSLNVDTGERRIEATGFTTPAAIKFNSQGELHVLDTATGEVIKVTGENKQVIATLEPGLDNFAFDENDTIFVSSFADGFIKRVNADGSVTTLQPGGMAHPGGLQVAQDIVWVADLHVVRGIDRVSGKEVITQRNIVGVGDMGGAMNLSVDGDHLVLTSWFDGDVRVWNPNTQRRIEHYPQLAGPVAAVRYMGKMAIAEHGKGAVTLYADGEQTVLIDGLPAPTGLLAQQGALYVSDRERGQILMIAQSGKRLSEPRVVARDLQSPEGFVMSKKGFVVLEAEIGKLVLVNAEGSRQVLATLPPGSKGAPGQPPSQVFNGVTIDDAGHLYVTAETSRVLYRLDASWQRASE